MKVVVRIALALVVALPLSVAAADLDTVIQEGEIFASWGPALRASSLDLSQPIKGTPIAYENGVAVYRVVGLLDGAIDYTLVAMPTNPMVAPVEMGKPELGGLDLGNALSSLIAPPPAGEPSELTNVTSRVTYNRSDSCRCIIYAYRNEYYSTLLLITNLDWNDFSSYPGLNDSFDSLQTTCNGAFFFTNSNWGGNYLYMNSNVSIPVLSIYGFHDNISSLAHDLP